MYYEIIYIRWTFNFVYFVGRAIHEFKIPTTFIPLELLNSRGGYGLRHTKAYLPCTHCCNSVMEVHRGHRSQTRLTRCFFTWTSHISSLQIHGGHVKYTRNIIET